MVYFILLNGQSASVNVIFPTSVSTGLFSNILKVSTNKIPIGLNSFIQLTLIMIVIITMEKKVHTNVAEVIHQLTLLLNSCNMI